MTETKKRTVDPIDNALRRVRRVPALYRAPLTPEDATDEALKDCRAACTALLRLTPEQRAKVLAAAEALGQ